MNLFKLFFSKKEKQEESGDLLFITKKIGPIIDNISSEIFVSYSLELLSQPITYIVPAVWGASETKQLTDNQLEMHNKINPAITKILEAFDYKSLTQSQRFALGYIVRGLIISKITYMIEAVKHQGARIESSDPESVYDIHHVKTIGNA